MNITHISPKVAKKLGYYVYLYIDPADNSVFYVGKGHGSRMLAHLSDKNESCKVKRIHDIQKRGDQPQIDILVHGLKDEQTALKIEAAVIDLLKKENLTNLVRGWESNIVGRMELNRLVLMYEARPVTITHPVILIRINQLYRYGMSARELYEATRGIWKVNPNLHHPKYAFAIYRNIVQEVYEINKWHDAGTTKYFTRDVVHDDTRQEFTGHVAKDSIRKMYIEKSVAEYLTTDSRNPIKYVNC